MYRSDTRVSQLSARAKCTSCLQLTSFFTLQNDVSCSQCIRSTWTDWDKNRRVFIVVITYVFGVVIGGFSWPMAGQRPVTVPNCTTPQGQFPFPPSTTFTRKILIRLLKLFHGWNFSGGNCPGKVVQWIPFGWESNILSTREGLLSRFYCQKCL